MDRNKVPVLLLVMSEACSACVNFKQNTLPKLEQELRKIKDVEFLKLEFPQMHVPPTDQGMKFEFHPSLYKYVKFFPTFLMFPERLWFDKGSDLEGFMMNAEEFENKGKIDLSLKGTLTWVNQVKYDDLFHRNSSTRGRRNILVVDRDRPLSDLNKQTTDGKVLVPTYGTYTKFRHSKVPESF